MKRKSAGKTVWQFTNQRKLTKKEFLDYFERKIFRTIRKFDMLPKDKIIKLAKEDSLNYKVLKFVLEKKFKVVSGRDFSSDNLSQIAEDIFLNVLKGKFASSKPDKGLKKPLYFLSDKEVELYAELCKIKAKKRKSNKKIQKLFEKFLSKNPDLEHNIVNSLAQL
jgi:hypothetical protein